MNTWRYVEVIVLLLQVDHEGGFAYLQENNSYRVDQNYEYAMAWEEVQKIACCMCSPFPPALSLKNHFLLHSSRN